MVIVNNKEQTMSSTQNQLDFAAEIKQLEQDEGYAYAAGYLSSMVEDMLKHLPKRCQKEYLQQLRQHNDDRLVEVKSLANQAMVKIRRKDLGGPCDPSTERYWSM
jgi:hypothetical protein